MLGEGRRVEHYEVVGSRLHVGEKLEGVAGEGVMAPVAGEIELYVCVGESRGLGRGVDGVDGEGSAAHGVDGEAAGVAEHIEHLAASGIALEQGAVVALVEEEAGLLPLHPVDVEAEAVLQGDVAVEAAHEILVLGIEPRLIRQGRLALVVDIADAGAGKTGEGVGDLEAREMHAGAVGLHHGGVGVDVDHEPGEEITLAVHKAVGVVVGADEAEGLAHGEGRRQTLEIEIVGQRGGAELEHPDGYAADLEVADTHERAVVGNDGHEVALLRIVGYGGDGSGEHPRMAAQQRLLLPFLQCYLIHNPILQKNGRCPCRWHR